MRLFICLILSISLIHAASSQTCFDVTDFGAVGDGITDDYTAIQNAIDSAEIAGNTVCIPAGNYLFSSTLTVPAGVSLQGEGMGDNPLGTPAKGSLLTYSGTSVAISVDGSNAIISDIVLLDNNNSGATKGIEIKADNILVESVVLKQVLISGFVDGAALNFYALNAGGIAYVTCYDVRVRHGKYGIHINEESGSFINSNSFYHGAISGGGFEKALNIEGGNNNLFFGTVIEPPASTKGHVYVSKGQIIGDEIRVEGMSQNDTVPLLYFSENAEQSIISGHFSGGLVINEGNNLIRMNSSKFIGEDNSPDNLLVNPSFYTNTASLNEVPQFWDISGAGVTTELQGDDFVNGSNVLKVTIPAGVLAKLYPNSKVTPSLNEHTSYLYSNFNTYIKTDVSDVVTTVLTGSGGLSTSEYHTGSDKWELVGLTVPSGTTNPSPIIWMDNTNSESASVIYITAPSFTFGLTYPDRAANEITGNGGIMTGTLTSGYSANYTFLSGTNYIVLNQQGNYFDISGSNIRIDRINHQTAAQMPRGTVMTLLFDNTGNVVTNSVYIKLKSAFTTATSNSSITLISNGDGTWREVSRNN